MPRVSLVGNGHGGSEDYATLDLWWAAESGVNYGSGSPIEAACLGSTGTTAAISGSSVNGALIYTSGVTYDGTNESSLAIVDRIQISAPNTTISDCYIESTSIRWHSCRLGANNVIIERNRIVNTTSSIEALVCLGSFPNSIARNNVISGGRDVCRVGSSNGYQSINNVIFGGSDKGFEGGSSGSVGIQFITNVFSFGNTGADIESGAFTVVTTATEDTSGGTTSGYTSSELVDFANGDYRTKATSTLATAGQGGTFIGAFLEASSGLTASITESKASRSNSSSLLVTPVVVNSISIIESRASRLNRSSVSFSIDLAVNEAKQARLNSSSLSVASPGSLSFSANENRQPRENRSSLFVPDSLFFSVNESRQPRENSSSFFIPESISASAVEIRSARYDISSLKAPVTIAFNAKNLVKVKRKLNNVKIKRKTNVIRVK